MDNSEELATKTKTQHRKQKRLAKRNPPQIGGEDSRPLYQEQAFPVSYKTPPCYSYSQRHSMQANTTNVHKTRVLLQTTGGKN
jgi:hypothetical protein